MTSKGHKKHADIKRPSLGQFARFELGLIGAPCNVIQEVVRQVADQLSGDFDITYIDADHKEGDLPHYANLSDKISHDRIDFDRRLNEYDRKILLGSSDIVLVNSNHFVAQSQIVFCTEKKRESLERKLDRLTDVQLIVLDKDIKEPYGFLRNRLTNISDIPIIGIGAIDQLVLHIREIYKSKVPEVKGLVLAGGKSIRMGEDKALINYHGMPQVSYACTQLKEAGIEPTISCRNEYSDLFDDQFPLQFDTYDGLGPFGAIVSAFRSDPNSAWLVIACDQPLIGSRHLTYLLQRRNTSKVATCYHNPETGFPEPLITLWEPKAYPRLLSFLSLGYSCPRKVLINSDIEELKVENTEFMINANTPEERADVIGKIH